MKFAYIAPIKEEAVSNQPFMTLLSYPIAVSMRCGVSCYSINSTPRMELACKKNVHASLRRSPHVNEVCNAEGKFMISQTEGLVSSSLVSRPNQGIPEKKLPQRLTNTDKPVLNAF